MKEDGFTIIEVAVAILIIGVTTIGLIMGFSNGLAMVEDIKQTSVADRLVQEKMEELRGNTELIPATSQTVTEGIYTITIEATSVAPALTQVSIKVNWISHTGKNLSRSLVTYFTENGITKSSD